MEDNGYTIIIIPPDNDEDTGITFEITFDRPDLDVNVIVEGDTAVEYGFNIVEDKTPLTRTISDATFCDALVFILMYLLMLAWCDYRATRPSKKEKKYGPK